MNQVDYAIDIVALSKRFRRHTLHKKGYTTLKTSLVRSLLSPFSGKRSEGSYTQAIRDLTMRVPRGASVGIIGQNGSGKSTLLKLITGIYKPDTGHVAVQGRVAALIELGAGFHPDFTGRENLHLGGVMHGLTRAQIEERFDKIVHFAELEDVIDDPVRTYSSGMFMRLGFSLAVHTQPDVLIIDEVLAVGDASFVARCKDRISQLRGDGVTLLLVSHDLGAVERWCDEALWLHGGAVKDRGNPRRVIDHYREFVEKGEESELQAVRMRTETTAAVRSEATPAGMVVEEVPASIAVNDSVAGRWGSREFEITSVALLANDGQRRLLFHTGDALTVEIEYRVNDVTLQSTRDLVFGVAVRRNDGLLLHGSNTDLEQVELPAPGLHGVVRYRIERLDILEGAYVIDAAVHKKDGYPYDYHQGALQFAVRSALKQVGVFAPPHRWEFAPVGGSQHVA